MQVLGYFHGISGRFGAALATGYINNDNDADLAIGTLAHDLEGVFGARFIIQKSSPEQNTLDQ